MKDKIINFGDYLTTYANIIGVLLSVVMGIFAWASMDATPIKDYAETLATFFGLCFYIPYSFGVIHSHNQNVRKNIADRKLEK